MQNLYRLFYFSYTLQQWLMRRFTPGGLLVLLCLVVSAFIGLDTKQAMAYQIFSFLSAILLIASAFSLRFRGRFHATRILPRFGTSDIKLQYKVIIHNLTSKIQRGLQLRENFANPCPSLTEFSQAIQSGNKRHYRGLGYQYHHWLKLVALNQRAVSNVIDLPPLLPHSHTEIAVTLTPWRRGIIRFTGLTITRSDPFGLFNACKTIALPQSLLILPKRYQLPSIQLPGSRRNQSGEAIAASSVGDAEEFMSLRDYRPGDPLRKIHWKSWAKTGQPVVREEQEQFLVRHALILDTFQTAKHSEILEEAVSVAASFACEVQTQESLLDLMFVGDESHCFTAGRGLGNTDKMLEILAAVTPCRDKVIDALTPVVINRASMLKSCICIFLTWDDARKKLVNNLRQLGVSVLILVITKDDIGDCGDIHPLNLGKIQESLIEINFMEY